MVFSIYNGFIGNYPIISQRRFVCKTRLIFITQKKDIANMTGCGMFSPAKKILERK